MNTDMPNDDRYYDTENMRRQNEQQRAEDEYAAAYEATLSEPNLTWTAVSETGHQDLWPAIVDGLYRSLETQRLSEQDRQAIYARIGAVLCGRIDAYRDTMAKQECGQ